MTSNKGERLIFVGGVPRSGTTLVQNILDSHQDIFGGPEFDRIPNIVDLRRKLHATISFSTAISKNKRYMYYTKEEADDAIASFIESLLLPVADKNSCKYLSEKTPWNILAFVDLLEIFPRARLIHVVRDPSAVIYSMIQVGKRAKEKGVKSPDFTKNIQIAINYIESCHKIAYRAAQLAPDRVMTVVYEDLVSDTESETKKICNFLQIEWSDSMLYPGKRKHAGEKYTTDIWYDKKMHNRGPKVSEINKWKSFLKPSYRVLISLTFRKDHLLMKYGYDFSLDDFSILNRLLGSIYYYIFRFYYGHKMAKLRVLP